MSGTTSGVNITQSGEDINLQIFRGKTLNFNIIWGGSTPIDITGFQACLQAESLDGDVLLDLDTANGGITIDGANGKLSFKASPVLTDQVKKPGRYELEMTNLSGDVFRVISGSIAPIAEIVQ